jgi:sugar phosphate isomerase/epimerase
MLGIDENNFAVFIQALKEIGYEGYLTIEYPQLDSPVGKPVFPLTIRLAWIYKTIIIHSSDSS